MDASRHSMGEVAAERRGVVELAREHFRRVCPDLRALSVERLLSQLAQSLLDDFANQGRLVAYLLARYSPTRRSAPREVVFAHPLALEEARTVVAREHGFREWSDVEACQRELDPHFEQAADAISVGDVKTLQRLLTANPGLAEQASPFGHQATLLHYVAGDHVELRRQIPSETAVNCLDRLLQVTDLADPEAAGITFAGARTPLAWLLTSQTFHATRQRAELVERLLNQGAQLKGPDSNGLPFALAILAGDRETVDVLLQYHAARDNLVAAAAAGEPQRVRALLNGESREQGVGPDSPYPLAPLEPTLPETVATARSFAKRLERQDVVQFLDQLRRGLSELLDAFDQRWYDQPIDQDRRVEEIAEVLPSGMQGPLRRQTFADLIAIDMEYRHRRAGLMSPAAKTESPNQFPRRPQIGDYNRILKAFDSTRQIPLSLIAEEFRIRLEAQESVTVEEMLKNYSEDDELRPLLAQLLRDVIDERHQTNRAFQVVVRHNEHPTATVPLAARLILGRQNKGEPAPYKLISTDGIPKLVIADRSERFLSRKHLELMVLPNGRIRVINQSKKNPITILNYYASLAAETSRDFSPPVSLQIESKKIEVTRL